MVHLSRAHATRRLAGCFKTLRFSCYFCCERPSSGAARRRWGAAKVMQENKALVFATLPPCNKKSPTPNPLYLLSFVHRISANIVPPPASPRSSVCRRALCKAPSPLVLLLKGRTGWSSSSLTQLLQLQVNRTKADMRRRARMQGRIQVPSERFSPAAR